MHFSKCITAIAAILPCVLAGVNVMMSNLDDLRLTNSVQQVAHGKKIPGPIAMANTYKKYNKQAPAFVLAAANRAMAEMASPAVVQATTSTFQTASVQATDLPNDKAYYVNVTVGSTKMLLNFDTGSSDLWVFSTKLPTAQRGTHKLYPLSGTLISGGTFSVSYAEGSGVSGIIYADKVVIGGVTATVQAVEAATSVSSSFTTGIQDGIVGLGFLEGNQCSPGSCYGFMHQAGPNMPKTILAATLKHNAPGIYDIGYIDSAKYTGALTYVNVDDIQGGGYWEFLADGYSVGSAAEVVGSIDVIADTGTSLAYVDDAILTTYYSGVTGATNSATYGGWIFPCTSQSQLPTFSYWISGTKHTMPGSYGVYLKMTTPSGYCFGGLQSNSGLGFTLLGDVFLKSQYVVFDYCLERIGWAQQTGVVIS